MTDINAGAGAANDALVVSSSDVGDLGALVGDALTGLQRKAEAQAHLEAAARAVVKAEQALEDAHASFQRAKAETKGILS